MSTAGGTGANGAAAKVTTPLPVYSAVLIVRSIGKYDPGDIDGDGKYTDADLKLLQRHIIYPNVQNTGNAAALGCIASYRLTGKALKAADVNSDGKIDTNDGTLASVVTLAEGARLVVAEGGTVASAPATNAEGRYVRSVVSGGATTYTVAKGWMVIAR